MASSIYRDLPPAIVDANQLNEIQSLEQELGSLVVALESPVKVPDSASNDENWAELSTEQLEQLQAVEKKLGVVMLAVQG